MANLVVYRRYASNMPVGVKEGSEVLYKRELCVIDNLDCAVLTWMAHDERRMHAAYPLVRVHN